MSKTRRKANGPARPRLSQEEQERQRKEQEQAEKAQRAKRCLMKIKNICDQYRCMLTVEAWVGNGQVNAVLQVIPRKSVFSGLIGSISFLAANRIQRVESCQIKVSDAIKEENCAVNAGLVVSEKKTTPNIQIIPL